jgi:spore germination cell wall hydrolase CwlJ-like protein
MIDADALALCAFEEANLEPDEGMAAVCRVVLNRAALPYQSDGTIQGAIFHPAAFSWTQYDMEAGHYVKVAFNSQDIAERAATLLQRARAYNRAWARCRDISSRVVAGAFAGALYDKITSETVLYVNEAISRPAWAVPSKRVVQIGRHTFFTA